MKKPSDRLERPIPRANDHPEHFGLLLKRYRGQKGLSQEALAERASISAAAVSTLERGTRRAPYRETVALLADALRLSADEKYLLENAAERARGRAEALSPSRTSTPRLPRYLTSFVGHEAEIRQAERLLANHRLVTLTGAGGVGKTRTALQIGQRLAALADGDTAFADLTTVTDGTFIVSLLESAMGAPVAEQGRSAESLAESLRSRSLLLILDNCEHVIEHVVEAVKPVLQHCLDIRILATSRERLGIPGEIVLRLPSLPVPDETPTNPDQALSFAAVRLFVERAALSEPSFAFTQERVSLVADICRRLDGIPLAIELAATRLPALGLRGLRDHLNNHFCGATRARGLPTRQQTMLATIAWSCDLLSDAERTVLRRLSTFAGSFTLEAAVALGTISTPGEYLVSASDVPDLVASLVDKSLIEVVTETDVARYRLLESVRAFQREQLVKAHESDACSRRLAEWLVLFSDRLSSQAASMNKHAWNTAVMPEFDNVRSALSWALDSADATDVVLAGQVLGNMRSLWVQSGRRIELRRWAEAAISRIDETDYSFTVGRLYLALLYSTTGDATFAAAERAIELFERSGNQFNNASVCGQLGYEYCRRGRFTEAEKSLTKAASIVRAYGRENTLLHAGILRLRAWVMQCQGKVEEARANLAAAAVIAQALGDDLALLQISAGLAEVEFVAGNVDEAALLEEDILSQSLTRPDRNRSAVEALCNLACFRLVLSQLPSAEAAARNALRRAEGRYPTLTPWAIQHFAAVAALRGEASRAARLLGYIEAWRRENQFARLPVEQQSYAILLASLRERLAPDEISVLAKHGEQLGFDQASDEVLSASAPDRATNC